MVQDSLKIHFATGRLWAALIQLQHAKCQTVEDFDKTQKSFQDALQEIPKSGEVWCEGARIAMSKHPHNKHYNLHNALKYLDFAI